MLLIAFILYCVATILFFIAITGRRFSNRNPQEHAEKFGWIAYITAAVGVVCQAVFIGVRTYVGGHFPISNMFEFMQFLGFATTLAFLGIYAIYRIPLIGAFVMPFGILVIAYASVFPREITPLIPALQSYWLQIHVTTAALGEGAFAVGFAGGLMYLLRTVNQNESSRSTKWLEFVMWVILTLVAFIGMTFYFQGTGYQSVFKAPVQAMGGQVAETEVKYDMPAIVGPKGGQLTTTDKMKPLFEAPGFMRGKEAARKFNTMIWSVIGGTVLYVALRLATRRRLAAPLGKWVRELDSDLVDEISYRAVAIGFPVFTLGALIFAMIWAHEAWGRFWGWDPKEVWALVTWLFYSAYLHLRLSRGWQGEKSAWMAVLGFIVVMFNLIFVNLVISGLHSYA
ncbi:c-type cytochrome biogenesis protein CcsB [Aneurinibacillus tyrosinisolvens]|uniref:c-type cytochrome biogenesis protein CcsB n=1 Tax=Aneurinibacillus tyrosinisolvens TaxID=1443435 RepID=UPI00063F1422|nr:c-type cytochrome biogenesis protein CcsB [Aneurinibacillus tyrosinisolvens]